MAVKILICILAGLGAGVGTGFAGMSAATVIAPMLVSFLGFDAYEAVGIALASDVLASAVSAYTYHKNKNVDVRSGAVMLVTTLLLTIVGSLVSRHVESVYLGGFSIVMCFFLGLRFLLRPAVQQNLTSQAKSARRKFWESLLCGVYIGFVCGFMGAGGGMMMLFVLTTILGYELKTAVGTSVFVMTFTALTGALSHFSLLESRTGHGVDWVALGVCVGSTLVFAQLAAKVANRVDAKVLNRMVGVLLTVLGAVMIAFEFFL